MSIKPHLNTNIIKNMMVETPLDNHTSVKHNEESMIDCDKIELDDSNKRPRLDNSIICNISAVTQPDMYFNGWIFSCNECSLKTKNYIICDNIYELYICRTCESKLDIKRSTDFCRYIARTKINIV